MTNEPSPLAKRIAKRIEEAGLAQHLKPNYLEIIDAETRDLRPISAYSQKLREIIHRIIAGGEPEVKAIASSLGIGMAEVAPARKPKRSSNAMRAHVHG